MKVSRYALGLALLLGACTGRTKLTEINEERVFFDFDKSTITSDAKGGLLAQSEFLKANPNVKVVVEGHCDERGTREYNLALGARRANASKQVLVKDGVAANRVKTVSYGKDRPWKKGAGEGVWKYNRNTTTIEVK